MRITKGLCEEGCGVVPCVYGLFYFPDTLDVNERQKQLYKTWLKEFAHDPRPPSALLLEYIEGEQLSTKNITFDIAKKVMKAVSRTHLACVVNADLYCRNILVTAEGRVVIVDFEYARVAPKDRFGKFTCSQQIHHVWTLLFRQMVSLYTQVLSFYTDQCSLTS